MAEKSGERQRERNNNRKWEENEKNWKEGKKVSHIEVNERKKLREQKRGWKEKGRRGGEGKNGVRGVVRKREKRERKREREKRTERERDHPEHHARARVSLLYLPQWSQAGVDLEGLTQGTRSIITDVVFTKTMGRVVEGKGRRNGTWVWDERGEERSEGGRK